MSVSSDPNTSTGSSENKNGKPRGKYKSLSIQDKLKVLDRIDEGGSVRSVCEEFDLSTTTYYDIKKSKEKLRSYALKVEGLPLEDPTDITGKRKRVKAIKFSELDQAVLQWCKQEQAAGVSVRGVDILAAAERFAAQLNIKDFMASRGWLHKFRSRHCLTNLSTQNHKKVKRLERLENSSQYMGLTYTSPLIHEFWNVERGTIRGREDSKPDTKDSFFDKEGRASLGEAMDNITDAEPEDKVMDFCGIEFRNRSQNDLISDVRVDSADSERSQRSPVSKEEENQSIPEYSAGHIHFLSENEKCRGNSVQDYQSSTNYCNSREHCSEIMTLRQEISLLRAMLENELKKNLSLQQKNEELQQRNKYLQDYLDTQRLCGEHGHEDPGRMKGLELSLGSKDLGADHSAGQMYLDNPQRKSYIETQEVSKHRESRSTSTEAKLLGDEKPSTLVESYKNVYHRERKKALEALDTVKDLKAADELKNQILLSVVVLAFKSSSRSLAHIRSEIYRLLQVHSQQPKDTEQEAVREQEDTFLNKLHFHTRALDLAISSYITANISQHDLSRNTEEVCELIYSALSDYPAIRDCEEVTQFIQTCTRLAWALTSQTPPFVITHDSFTFRPEEHIRFPMSLNHSSTIKMYHWPALFEGPGGPCVSKAIVVTH